MSIRNTYIGYGGEQGADREENDENEDRGDETGQLQSEEFKTVANRAASSCYSQYNTSVVSYPKKLQQKWSAEPEEEKEKSYLRFAAHFVLHHGTRQGASGHVGAKERGDGVDEAQREGLLIGIQLVFVLPGEDLCQRHGTSEDEDGDGDGVHDQIGHQSKRRDPWRREPQGKNTSGY